MLNGIVCISFDIQSALTIEENEEKANLGKKILGSAPKVGSFAAVLFETADFEICRLGDASKHVSKTTSI